jgi:hypothetical protein
MDAFILSSISHRARAYGVTLNSPLLNMEVETKKLVTLS